MNNSLIEHLGQWWDGYTSVWVNNDKYTNTYGTNNNQTESSTIVGGFYLG